MNGTTSQLADGFGRRIDYVRLSVTDRCNYRCVYCMAEDMVFLPNARLLTMREFLQVARAFVSLGTTRIRITGGEPLVRPDIVSIVEEVAAIPGLDEVTMTTNGAMLEDLAVPLKTAGLARINVSLDSLDPARFRELTRVGKLDQVLRGIGAAQEAGIRRIRLNSVILRGRNDGEVLDLVRFARESKLDIAFIEEMPLGVLDEHDRLLSFVPSDELVRLIATQFPIRPIDTRSAGPARYYAMADSNTRVGFISPHSQNFCATCNRVRVTAEGRLLLCLGNEDSVDLRAVLRGHPDDLASLRAAIVEAMQLKPERHYFDLRKKPSILRFMNTTGG